MKFVAEILIALLLHPIAIILAWINLAGRNDLDTVKKVLWAVLILVAWGIGPILYMLLADGSLW